MMAIMDAEKPTEESHDDLHLEKEVFQTPLNSPSAYEIEEASAVASITHNNDEDEENEVFITPTLKSNLSTTPSPQMREDSMCVNTQSQSDQANLVDNSINNNVNQMSNFTCDLRDLLSSLVTISIISDKNKKVVLGNVSQLVH